MLWDEQGLPYERPPLSKDFLSGERDDLRRRQERIINRYTHLGGLACFFRYALVLRYEPQEEILHRFRLHMCSLKFWMDPMVILHAHRRWSSFPACPLTCYRTVNLVERRRLILFGFPMLS